MKIYEWVELRSVEQVVALAVINFCTLSDSMFIATYALQTIKQLRSVLLAE